MLMHLQTVPGLMHWLPSLEVVWISVKTYKCVEVMFCEDVLRLLMCMLLCAHVNSYWCVMVACFTPEISLSCPDEWSRIHGIWYFSLGHNGSVYSDSWKHGSANLALVALVWSGSIHPVVVCGKHFSCCLEGNHREHSVFPTDVETTKGELKQSS